MLKRAFLAGAGFFAFCVAGQATPWPLSDGMAPDSSSAGATSEFASAELRLGSSWPNLPLLALEPSGPFSYPGTFGWMESQEEFLPAFRPVPPRRLTAAESAASLTGKDDSLVYLGDEKPDLFYTGGEVGFVYGRYTGKGGGSIQHGYFMTEIGNDKFRLRVGASYTEDEGRYPHRRRR